MQACSIFLYAGSVHAGQQHLYHVDKAIRPPEASVGMSCMCQSSALKWIPHTWLSVWARAHRAEPGLLNGNAGHC